MEQLKRLRSEKGLSQARLAARAGLDPSTVNQIERGAREASPPTLRKLADALDVSIADLLESETGKVQSLPPDPEGVRRVRIQGEVSERTRRTPYSITVTHAGLEDVLEDVEAGRVEDAATKLRELIGSTA